MHFRGDTRLIGCSAHFEDFVQMGLECLQLLEFM